MNKYLKYTIKGFAILLTFLLALYIIGVLYVTVNRQKIIKQVTDEIGKKLTGNVSIGDVELNFIKHFPQVSVLLRDVKVTDTMFAVHHHPFFHGKEVSLRLSVTKMIQKQQAINGVRIDNGTFYMYTDTSGYTNRYLFSSKDTGTKKQGKNELKKIVLNNVRLIDDNKQKNKLFDISVNDLDLKLDDKDSRSFLFSAKTNMLIHSLAFNLERGSFIKNKTLSGKFDVRFDKILKQLQFDNINIRLADHPFNITAKFDLAGDNRQFSLKVRTKKILYPFAKTLLTPKIATALSIANVDKPLDIDADLSGPLKGGDPLVFIQWQTKGSHLTTPFLEFDNASFKGVFTNEVVAGLPRKDPNSKIVITEFAASWKDLPVTSDKIEIVDLAQPLLACNLRSSFTLTTLNDIIGSNALRLRSGDGFADISYKGPLQKNNNTNSFVNGAITFKNGTVLYAPRNVELKNVNGRLLFRNSDVFVENLQCVVLNNKVVMQGQAHNLLTLIDAEPNKVIIDWNIFSPSLNLNAFTFLLNRRQVITDNNSAKQKLQKMASKIDEVLEKGSLNISLRADKLHYKKFTASNAAANILLLPDRYVINNVSMEHAGGRMELKGALLATGTNFYHATVNALLHNVDVSKVFAAFDNFGQDGITAESLQGNLSAKVDASMDIDNEGRANPSSIQSLVDFSLKNGALINYEPVKKLQNFLFKNRDFENIRFAELKNRLEIRNQEVKINRMEIQSNIMSLFVEGLYSKKGNTDLSIQVPLSNIHRRGVTYNPENIGTDKKGGSSIHIRGRPGPDGNIKFKLDLFNKFKREKEKAENAAG